MLRSFALTYLLVFIAWSSLDSIGLAQCRRGPGGPVALGLNRIPQPLALPPHYTRSRNATRSLGIELTGSTLNTPAYRATQFTLYQPTAVGLMPDGGLIRGGNGSLNLVVEQAETEPSAGPSSPSLWSSMGVGGTPDWFQSLETNSSSDEPSHVEARGAMLYLPWQNNDGQ